MSSRPENTAMQLRNSDSSLDRADIVIIGNGIAGLTAAVEARHLAPDKSIVMITDQLHPTINTPSLKQFATDKLSREQLLAYPPGTERAERIHVVTSHVEAIHPPGKYISLSGDRGFGYDSLLIATGGKPTSLPAHTPGLGFDGVLTLHRLQDYLDLRRRIPEINDAVVIGGGIHAIETVMGLAYWGIHVHWLLRNRTFLSHTLDQIASDMILNTLRRSSISIHTETEVSGIVGRVGSVAGVITNQQEMLPCQIVLTCTGTKPAIDLAQNCSVPMLHQNGIMVDDRLRTHVRDIYAAGDVAALKNPLTGNYETRALWYAASEQGRIAGAMMAGHDDRARKPFGVQWHATQIGNLSMLTVGSPLSKGSQIVTLTDQTQGNYRRLAIIEDRLTGYLSLGNSQPDGLAIKRIIEEGHSIRPITRALLKGNFNAREYLSHQHSRTAHHILTGKLSAPKPTKNPPAPLPLPLGTGKLALPQPRIQERSIGLPQPVSPQMRQLPTPSLSDNKEHQEQMVLFEDEINPFSGNLPAIVPAGRGNPMLNQYPANSQPDMLTEEINPFTGNLPALPKPRRTTDDLQRLPGMIQYSPPARPAPINKDRLNNKLWAYAEALDEE